MSRNFWQSKPVCHVETSAGIHLQSELGQFDGDSGVGFAASDFFQKVDVAVGREPCLAEVANLLAEDIECRANAAFVEPDGKA